MFNTKVSKQDLGDGSYILTITARIIDKELQSFLLMSDKLKGIGNMLAEKIAEDIYPLVKDQLLSGDGMLKLQNEIRLDILKRLNEEGKKPEENKTKPK